MHTLTVPSKRRRKKAPCKGYSRERETKHVFIFTEKSKQRGERLPCWNANPNAHTQVDSASSYCHSTELFLLWKALG